MAKPCQQCDLAGTPVKHRPGEIHHSIRRSRQCGACAGQPARSDHSPPYNDSRGRRIPAAPRNRLRRSQAIPRRHGHPRGIDKTDGAAPPHSDETVGADRHPECPRLHQQHRRWCHRRSRRPARRRARLPRTSLYPAWHPLCLRQHRHRDDGKKRGGSDQTTTHECLLCNNRSIQVIKASFVPPRPRSCGPGLNKNFGNKTAGRHRSMISSCSGGWSQFNLTTSTRRFLARPSSASFEAAGASIPTPAARSRFGSA